jgi:hypothetical protein
VLAVTPSQQETRAESALYWSAISLIVCEGLTVGEAADRLGVENGRLRTIMRRRRRRSALPQHSRIPRRDECH